LADLLYAINVVMVGEDINPAKLASVLEERLK
jgi:phosphoribosyl-ATP pyrophosphohydrolase